MKPFATRFSHLTERQRNKTALVGAWSCGALTGAGVGVGMSLGSATPTGAEGVVAGLMAGAAMVAGVTLAWRFDRFLMRYAPGDETLTGESLDATGGCSGECYSWRRPDDPNAGGCGGGCEGLRQQPQPEPNHDTR